MNELIIKQKQEMVQNNIEELYTRTLSDKTKLVYTQVIKTFFNKDNLNDISIEEMRAVTPSMVNDFAHRLLEEGQQKSTINKKLSALHNFFKFLCRKAVGVLDYNPADPDEGAIRFKNTTKSFSDKRTLTPDEVKLLFQSAKETQGITGVRDLLILQLLATTGMRRAELCGIKLGDISTSLGSTIILITGKGEKSRLVAVSDEVNETINEYLKLRKLTLKQNPSEPLITSHSNNKGSSKFITENAVYNVIKKHANNAGIDASTISPHSLRHTFATLSHLELGISKDDLQELMGHTSVSTTNRYIKAADITKISPADKLSKLYSE